MAQAPTSAYWIRLDTAVVNGLRFRFFINGVPFPLVLLSKHSHGHLVGRREEC